METVKEKLAKYKAIMNSVCESCTDTCDFDYAIDCLEGELEKRGLFTEYATDTNVGDKWVSVDERLPEFVKVEKQGDFGNVAKSVRVLCSCLQKDGKQMVKEGYCQRWLDGSGAVWWKIPGTINKVTHWMPLPASPKGVQ